jgi:hypothetical protein
VSKKKKQILSFKFDIQNDINIGDWLYQYNIVVRSAYNRFRDNPELPLNEIVKLVNDLNGTEKLDYSIKKSACYEALSLKDREGVIFGSKKSFNAIKFFNLKKNPKISIEECRQNFKDKRNLRSMLLVGCANEYGNRKAELDIIGNNSIVIKFDKKNHIVIKLPELSKKRKDVLYNLQNLCDQNKACYSLKLNNKSISIIIEDKYIKDLKPKLNANFVKNRILSLDLNPNYIGLSICDWHTKDNKTIIYKEIIDVTELNKLQKSKYKKNKRDFETSMINSHIIDLIFNYRCELAAFEHLDIESKDHCRGKRFNRLVNNCWNRTKFLNNLIKRCNISKIKHREIRAQYSSFIGQMMHPTEYDSVAASIEISRRANLMNCGQYKDIIYPRFDVSCIPTLEGNGTAQDVTSWKKLYTLLKKSKIRYRFLFDPKIFSGRFLRLKSKKSLVMIRFV